MKAEKTKIIKRIVFVFSFCLVVSVSLIVFFSGAEHFAWRSDFVSFVTGARIIRYTGAKSLYDLSTQQEHQLIVTAPNRLMLLPYRNLPVVAFAFIPFTFLPIFPAYKIYTLILALVTTFYSWVSIKAFKNIKKSYWFLLPFIFYPSLVAIFAGQISVFLVLAYFSIFYYLKKEKPLIVGVIVGLLLLKTQYIVSLPFVFLLVRNKKDFLKGFFVSSFLILAASVCLSGFGLFENYLKMIISTEDPAYCTRETSMFSLLPALTQITTLTKQSLVFVNFVLYALAIWFFYKNNNKWSLEIGFVITILLTLVFCIHGGDIDMALLVLPLWLLIDVYKSTLKPIWGNVIVIFILIFSSLFFILKLSYIIPFLFLLSVALLVKKRKLKLSKHKVLKIL